MRNLTNLGALALCLVTLSLGCREDDPKDLPDAGVLPDYKVNPGADGLEAGARADGSNCMSYSVTTIPDITAKKVVDGSCVELSDVVVTAVDGYGSYTGDIFVQDSKGGKGSGTKLYYNKRTDGKQVSELKAGDHIKVKGRVKHWHPASGEFSDTNYPNKKSIIELENNQITLISSGAEPTPLAVTAKELTDAATADQYEHVLVKVKDASVVKINPADPKYKNVDVVVMDSSATVEVRDDLYSVSSLQLHACHSFVGVVSYFFGYRVLVRTSADITAGTGCKTPTALAINDLQDTTAAKHPKDGDWVKVTGVVTAVDANPYVDTAKGTTSYSGFWVQDEKGGQYSGIYVYYTWTDKTATALVPVRDQKMEISGYYKEYGATGAKVTLSELTNVSWVDKGKVTALAPATVNAADIAPTGTAKAQWEGVLVKVSSIKVGKLVTDTSGKTIGFTDDTTKLPIIYSNYNFTSGVKVGDTYSTVAGVLYIYKEEYQLLPREAGDLVK